MPRHSAGVLLHRATADGGVEVFLVHPGGPLWANRHEHAWSIPKGEFDPEVEDAREAAEREWVEETGFALPTATWVPLPEVRASGKVVHAFAVAGDVDPDALVSEPFDLEWPPRSGRTQAFPEVDRGAWVPLADAVAHLHKGQARLVEHLRGALDLPDDPGQAG